MKLKIIFLSAFCLFLFSFSAISQNEGNGLSQKYTSKKAIRLAAKLTKDKASDKEKLDAIFYWIANNIKYDVKKFFKNDTRRMSTNKILRKKKGLCTAYSQLFGELCFHAGLKTVEVEGYTKSLFTDADDKYYYTDHVWNSIELDGKWELIDMTWCSGSIKFTGQSPWQKFLKVVSFGAINKQGFRPHYVKSVNKKYFLPDPNILTINHLPLNPIWQLMEQPITINEFERDSSEYYKAYPDHYPAFKQPLQKNILDPKVEFELDEYYTQGEKRKKAKNGDDGNNFNIKNSICKATGESNKALLAYNITGKKQNLQDFTPKSLEAVVKHCLITIDHTKCHNTELKAHKLHLDANNNLKKKIVNDEVGRLLALTNPIYNGFRIYGVKFRAASKSTRSYRKKISTNHSKQTDESQYNKTEFAKPANPKAFKIKTENDACFEHYNKLSDSLSKLKTQYEEAVKEFDLNNKIKSFRAHEYVDYSNKNNELLKEIMWLRLNYFDAIDYEIQHPRGKYLFSKVLNDSGVYIGKQLFPQSILDELKELRSSYDRIQKIEGQQGRELIKIKKNSSPNDVIGTIYKNWQTQTKEYYKSQIKLLSLQTDTLNSFIKKFSSCRRVAGREISKLKSERKLELKMYKFRRSRINSDNKSRKSYNKSLGKSAAAMMKTAAKQKQTLEKAEAAGSKQAKK